jgi:hypothetical protein
MKALFISIALVVLVAGCTGVETIRIDPNDKYSYYTLVKDPEKAYKIVATDYSGKASGSFSPPTQTTGTISGSAEFATKNIMLAQLMDQLNTQTLSAYKAALFGLNVNPTADSNIARYWDEIRVITTQMATIRAIIEAKSNLAVNKYEESMKSGEIRTQLAIKKPEIGPTVKNMLPDELEAIFKGDDTEKDLVKQLKRSKSEIDNIDAKEKEIDKIYIDLLKVLPGMRAASSAGSGNGK